MVSFYETFSWDMRVTGTSGVKIDHGMRVGKIGRNDRDTGISHVKLTFSSLGTGHLIKDAALVLDPESKNMDIKAHR